MEAERRFESPTFAIYSVIKSCYWEAWKHKESSYCAYTEEMADREEILADFQVNNQFQITTWPIVSFFFSLQAFTGIEDVEQAILQLEDSNWDLMVITMIHHPNEPQWLY